MNHRSRRAPCDIILATASAYCSQFVELTAAGRPAGGTVGVPPHAWTPTSKGKLSGLTASIINTMPPTVYQSQMSATGGGKRQETIVRLTIIDVLGDFNRRFNVPNDQVWTELDDGEPTNADLTTVTKGMPISCWDNTFTEFIDHIVLDRRVLLWVDGTSFRHLTYR